jgi:DeoR/GlpR family transcriptional regulator of sugar metabolism
MVEERRQELIRQVRDEGRVLAVDAAKRFGVSEDSIRRDLRALASAGLVQRVRGGALAAASNAPFRERTRIRPTAVRPLAGAVARRVEEIGGIVVLDSGSTNVRVAEALTSSDLTVVTSSPAIGTAASANGVRLIMLGGVVGADIGASVDATAVDALRLIRADVAVLGACAVDPKIGVSSGRADEVTFKRAVVCAGAELIVAATTDKLGTAAAFAVAGVGEITSLFTEPDADADVLAEFRHAGVEVENG